ncbi:hypothetical protein [Nocardioides halotolerans]|uniref:hypothetical protein n=1 Tax=Nocardioides halotolerans TaxID=433660 RepID=UPI0004065521|nr:hypothetical protein [Nocardioides halotolerans]
MNLTKISHTLTTVLYTRDLEPNWEDLITDAGVEYAHLALRRMIDNDYAWAELLEDFSSDFANLHLLAQHAVHAELTNVAHHAITEAESPMDPGGLAPALQLLEDAAILDEHRVLRWLAELIWSGPGGIFDMAASAESPQSSAEVALVVATLALFDRSNPHEDLDAHFAHAFAL